MIALKNKDLRKEYIEDSEVRNLIDVSRGVEGMPRHASTHAAGVVITKDPTWEYVPLSYSGTGVVTQFDMNTDAALGLVKFDFLGLRYITVLHDAEMMIRKREPDFDLSRVPFDDKKTFELLSDAKTDGVFQLESAGMKAVLSRLMPSCFEDIIACIALFRPGPMDSIDKFIARKNGKETTEYEIPELAEILDVTYGCMVYQEQVMQICRKIAGYSYGRADLVRRAMSKKKLDVMEKERHNFIYGLKNENGEIECEGALANGVSEETANEIFDEMSNFAKYAFNKSHAAAYAYVSYQTAWLKAHYPCELMAATLTSVLDSSVKVSSYIAECTRLGIKVLAPNINNSFEGFTVKNGQIRFGLLAIKNLGRNFIKTIIDNREQGGRYTSFYTFCKRVYSREFNKRAVESLIKCGACDGLDLNRRQMLYMLPLIISELDSDKNRNVIGQIGFFDADSGFSFETEMVSPELEELPKNELLAYEKEITGLYISGHPMDEYSSLYDRLKCDRITDIIENSDTIIDFCKCQDSSSYVLIYDTMPWWMSHEDWKLLESPDDAKNYILNFLKPVLKDGYDKEQLMLWIGIVQDIYENGEEEADEYVILKCGVDENGYTKGIFTLRPLTSEEVKDGGKAYMICDVCGCYSHL